MESFSDKLKALGFKVASNLSIPEKSKQKSLEDVISGTIVTNSLGSFVSKEELFPFGYKHGKVFFIKDFKAETIKQAGKIESDILHLSDLLFLDTETTGLSSGSGTFAFLIGIGRFSEEGFLLQQFIIKDPVEESSMLLHLGNLIRPNDSFVSFNGKSFDLPLLKMRMIMNKLPFLFQNISHLDLLHISRRIWKKKLSNCSLKEIEKEILLLEREDDDIPGWMIPETYFDYTRTGNADKLKNVIYHNAQDIISLAALFFHISEILENNIEVDGISAQDLIAIGKIYMELKSYEIAERIYNKCLNLSMTDEEVSIVNHTLGMYHKKNKELLKAVDYWRIATGVENVESCVELAMYYEHVVKDFVEADFWAQKAGEIIQKKQTYPGMKRSLKEINQRINRLQVKVRTNV